MCNNSFAESICSENGWRFTSLLIRYERRKNILLSVGGRGAGIEDWMWIQLDPTLVQILVQVAIRLMKFQSVKASNGSERMANDFWLVGPKLDINLSKVRWLEVIDSQQKGIALIFANHDEDEYDGDVSQEELTWLFCFMIIEFSFQFKKV